MEPLTHTLPASFWLNQVSVPPPGTAPCPQGPGPGLVPSIPADPHRAARCWYTQHNCPCPKREPELPGERKGSLHSSRESTLNTMCKEIGQPSTALRFSSTAWRVRRERGAEGEAGSGRRTCPWLPPPRSIATRLDAQGFGTCHCGAGEGPL